MKLTLVNDTSYKDIRVVLGSREHFLKKGENIFEEIPNELQLKVNIYDKNKVYFWSMILLNILFFEWLVGDELGSAQLMCNSDYIIATNGDECIVKLSSMSATSKNGISYSSVYLDTSSRIESVFHSINDKENTRKKLKKRNVQVILFSVVISVLLLLINVGIAVCFAVLSLFEVVPSVIRLLKIKDIFSDEQAGLILNEKILEVEEEKRNPKGLVESVFGSVFKKRKK